jgi:hypothetical protein
MWVEYAEMLQVVGRIVTSVEDYDTAVFLNLSQVIWSRFMGDPRSPSTSHTIAPYTEKFYGHYSWPFTLTLPLEITCSSNASSSNSVETCYLPMTFLERNTKVSVQYDICAHIRRGKFRPDSK